MEQTTRKRSERAPAEQVKETPEAEADREARLADLDELLDEIDDILEENEGAVSDSQRAIDAADADATLDTEYAQLARLGLYAPDDLEEGVAADLVAYAEELAAMDADALQAELTRFTNEQNPPCSWCGACPVKAGCPFQADGEEFYRSTSDGTFIRMWDY